MRKKTFWANLPIILLGITLAGIIGVSCYTDPPNQEQKPSADHGSPSAAVASNQTNQTGENRSAAERPPKWRRLFYWPEGVEALAISATLFFIAWQALLTRQAIVSSDEASEVELRAYLVVAIGTGVYQEREKGLKFDGQPSLINVGKTPAHNVRYRTNSAILDDDVALQYSFPPGDKVVQNYSVGMNVPLRLTIIHRDYCDPQDVETVMNGDKKAFFYWGVIDYDDVFGNPQQTEFCHRIHFYKDSSDQWKVNGTYIPGRNRAT